MDLPFSLVPSDWSTDPKALLTHYSTVRHQGGYWIAKSTMETAPMVVRVVVLALPSQAPGQGVVWSQDSTERSWLLVSRFCYTLMKYSCDRRARGGAPWPPPGCAVAAPCDRAMARALGTRSSSSARGTCGQGRPNSCNAATRRFVRQTTIRID